MYATAIDSAIFRDTFSTEAMRKIFSDEARVQYYLNIEAALARVQARLGIIPAEAAEEICRHCDADRIRHGVAEEADRADRLPCPARGAAAGRPLPRRARRVVPLGRHHPGHHRHRHRPADPRRAHTGGAGPTGYRRVAGGAGGEVPRHAHGRAQQPAAGDADHLRLQMRRAAGRLPAAPAATGGTAAAGPGRRVRRGDRHAGLARRRWAEGAGRADAGTRARPARDRLAHHARPHRRGRLLPRPGHRHARQDQHGREADDADRGGGGLRALRRGPRQQQHHAAEAQPDLLELHPCLRLHGAAACGRPTRRHGRGPRALDGALGDRVDRGAGDLLPFRRGAGAGALPGGRAAGRPGADAGQSRPDQGAGGVRGGDDGPRPRARPAAGA